MSNIAGLCTLIGFLVLATLSPTAAVYAREDGLDVESCDGCHRAGNETQVQIGMSPGSIGIAQTVRLTVSIAAVNGNRGGLYLQATPGLGTLKLVPGEPTKLTGSNGLVHSAPKLASGSSVQFLVDWTAPNQPGGVEFKVHALSANGDGSSSGDGAGYAYASLAFGCTPLTFYPDRDGDGYGAPDGEPRMACAAPQLFSATRTDCNDNDQRVMPGATEVCNGVDDDCDLQTDEGLTVHTYCEDNDGDGHGAGSARTLTGCKPAKGFGSCDDDCDDENPLAYPGAPELCNYEDDNCNQRVDDGAKTTCGVGWCRRSGDSCASDLCVPGPPRAELCNAFDDDCDGVDDNGTALCGVGKSCVEGVCTAEEADAGAAASPSDGGSHADALPSPSDAEPKQSSGAGCSVGSKSQTSVAWLLLLLAALHKHAARRHVRHRVRR